MTTRLLNPDITIEIDAADFQARDNTEISLDASSVPYATARVELPLLDDTTLAFLDPRDNVRAPITAGDLAGTPRSFDLGLRERVVDHVSKTVTLTLAGDEALLMDYAPLMDDTGPRAVSDSLRDVCDYVLDKIGASLEAGDDEDVTAYWLLTNLIPNPDMIGNITGYLSGGGCTIAYNAATGAISGSGFLRATMTGTTGAIYLTTGSTVGYAVTPGRAFNISLYARTSNAGASMTITARWLNSDNAVIKTQVTSAASLPTSWGTRYNLTVVAPVGATKLVPFVGIIGTASARNWDLDKVMLVEADELVDYFDGAVTPTGYTVGWTDTANASPSTRTPIVDRPREALTWRAGQTAWEFLLTLCASVGMVLWCDEARQWFLQTPESRTLPDLISVSGANAREGTDTLSRADTETYVTGVVCRYSWTDSDGVARTQVDAAGTPDKVLVREFDTPFPGAGVAAAMLARREGTGRAQDVTAITKWSTTPGMTAIVDLPGAPETFGRVAAVTFQSDGFMALGLSGLIDIIPGSIASLTGTIDALTGTIDSL